MMLPLYFFPDILRNIKETRLVKFSEMEEIRLGEKLGCVL